MKKTILSLFAVGALALASCSSDEIKGGSDLQGQDGEPIGYMGFTIATDLSRAEWTDGDDQLFDDGDVTEYTLAPHAQAHLAIFFSQDGNYYGSSYLTPYSKDQNVDHNASHDAQYPEQFYTYITRWRNADQRNLPTSVVVLINEDPKALEVLRSKLGTDLLDLDAVLKFKNEKECGAFNYGGATFFTMSNSVYTDAQGALVNATSCEGKVCATVAEALANKVVVYVERLLAKHTLTVNNEHGSPVPVGEGQLMKPSATYGQDPEHKQDVQVLTIAKYPADQVGTEEVDLDWPTTVPKAWAAYIDGWNMNGLEANEFSFKQVDKDADYFAAAPNAANLAWSNANLHRSYWAESTNYKTDASKKYPTQYRDYKNEPAKFTGDAANKGYNYFEAASEYDGSAFDAKDGYTLRFISYKEIYNNKVYSKKSNNESDNYDLDILGTYQKDHRYSLERTYNLDVVADKYEPSKGYAPYKMATHFLLGATLLIGDEIGTLEAKTKLYAYNWYWTGEDNVGDYIRYSYRRLASFIDDGYTHDAEDFAALGDTNMNLLNDDEENYVLTAGEKKLYVKDAEGNYHAIEVATAANIFELAPAELYHGDGKVVIYTPDGLFVKATTVLTEEAKKDNNKSARTIYVPLRADEKTKYIYANTDAARFFNEGAMYYAIPVQHQHGRTSIEGTVGGKNMVEVNKYAGYETDDNRDTTDAYTLGQFGVVRNHWYKVNVSAINKIGIPVHDPDQPIIPDPEDEWAVAFEIVVLPWHVIDMGDVEL